MVLVYRNCYDGPVGIQLQREAARKTAAARPQRIAEVPYILFNGYSPRQPANTISIMALDKLIYKWAKEVRR